jgi:type II secretory ATPase GspE/PulE/Tfp pilus assembly ATPase PilB-like protein
MTADNIKTRVDKLIYRAIYSKASDIHVEPQIDSLKLRYRIDGILQTAEVLTKDIQNLILTRIKIMVNLDISENRLPQDGRISFLFKEKSVDLRISTLPTIYGEKIVIRILDPERIFRPLEKLGFDENEFSCYKKLIALKTGIILITGPTGSGKTTTLYATIKDLDADKNNIITIEDPVEYKIPNITQVQVNYKTGLTFSRGLKAILRQDPDIIFIGEIRDFETAQIAFQSALTGHLVFATLHTNDAISTVVRLTEMGIDPYLIGATLKGVISQRLTRRIDGGQTGIFELLKVSDKLRGLITSRVSRSELQKVIKEEGFKTMWQNALNKQKNKEITQQEIDRVLGEEN